MTAHYRFDIDAERSLVRITVGGFFELDDVAGFAAAQREAYARLRCPPNRHVTLCDHREMKIQSKQVVAMFKGLLADPAVRSRRIAFLVNSTLARQQLMRVIGGLDAACFEDAAAAEAWLLGTDKGSIAA